MSISNFLSESKAALLIIIINVIAFYYWQTPQFTEEQRTLVLLTPGNLLSGRVWTLMTSGFIHGGFSHIFMNMLGALIFARIVERHLGVLKTLFIYCGALVISMLFSTVVYVFVFQKNVAIIGASGAVMGLLGAAVLLDPFCITYEMILPIPVMVKGWIFIAADLKGFLGGENDGVSHLAHLFGFISIAILVYFLSHQDKRQLSKGLIINIISLVMFVILRDKIRTLPL